MSFPTSQEAQSSLSLDCVPQCHRFTFHEIQVATINFDESLVIGHGGFGKVYKGTFTNGESVLDAAIKRLESTSDQGAEEFWAEVEMLSKLRHCNLVSLIGYCNDGNEMILVYEYMPNGTLSDHLNKRLSPLTWVRRLKISIGAARGLDYLHTGTGISQGVVHRDVKSSNILLDGSWASKVSDFGLSKIVPTNQALYSCQHVGERKALDTSLDDEEINLAAWAQDSIKEGRLKQTVDSNLRGTISSKCMNKFAQLANECLHIHPKKRPTMAQVPAFGIPSSNENSVVGSSSKSLESYLYTVGGENRILHRFDFKTINIATEKFSRSNEISWNTFCELMHKGKLENGQDITVVGPYPHEGYDYCMNQVSILVKVEHPNLAQLSGWCIERSSVYLIYDTPHNYATLEHITTVVPLDWDDRYKILLGVARVLVYLHEDAPVRVLYGDVKAWNILLDEGLDPKLHGFYFALSAAINGIDCVYNNKIRGTKGVIAPEYVMYGRLSPKTDVFDFGMLVLETIAGCSMYSSTIESKGMFYDYDYVSVITLDHNGLVLE
ncbi:uncharacterized protein LOC143581293 [Bidens hawaiensis]|uniref:uncharacterized protein LOC143581293 n=1 Tax=Bidens hawaiensis TaxID=980011 RepID=UPI00404AB9CD